MATTALGMSKDQLVQLLGSCALGYGAIGLVAPRALAAPYGIPSTPHTTQLLRLFGTRMLAQAAWTFTARTAEEKDRLLAVAAGMNLLDALTALTAGRAVGRTSAVRAGATSAFFGAVSLFIRSLED